MSSKINEIVTDDLSNSLDRNYRNQLINNFEIIKNALRTNDNENTHLVTSEELDKALEDLDKKINRITMGVDHDTIKNVVEEILKERGL